MNEAFIEITYYTILIITLLYTLLILFFCNGWIKTKKTFTQTGKQQTRVSIIIAVRNEENTISNCLDAVLNQNYPKELTEIIVINDMSEDGTYEKVKDYEKKHTNILLINIHETNKHFGKKEAIKKGIEKSTGELIITTDADCIMGNKWLEEVVAYYQASNAKMIVSPVSFHNEISIFEKMQSLEFMALVASGAASNYYNKNILCNGANLAYSKKTFFEVGGFSNNENIATGDDVLLMYKIQKQWKKGVRFLKSKEAIVYTKAKSSLREFIEQRKRWSSKPMHVLNVEAIGISLVIYVLNTLLLIGGILALLQPKTELFQLYLYQVFLILFGTKCLIDFLFLNLVGSFFDKKRFLLYFLPEQILYIPYVFIIGTLGTFSSYKWKGRKIK